MNRSVLLPIALAIAACTPTATEPTKPDAPGATTLPVTLGVLEDRPGATTGEAARFVVRALFQKDGAGWKSLSPGCSDEACLAASPATFPAEVDWTIVQGGMIRGSVTAKTPAAWTLYGDVGTQEVASGPSSPTVGQRTMEFAGDTGTPVYRPLVAVVATTVSDPDKWTTGALSPAALASLQGAFRAKFSEVTNCKTDGGADPTPMAYEDAAIVTSGVSVSATGWTVATAQLADYRCDGPWDETAFASQTFAISPEGKTQFLGEGLRLVDAGDYDADSKSELMFAISTYNTGGYDLRFNDFAGQATFAFSYH